MELEMDRLVISSLFCFFLCLLRGSLNLGLHTSFWYTLGKASSDYTNEACFYTQHYSCYCCNIYWVFCILTCLIMLELGMRILSNSRARSEMPLERNGISRTCEGSVVFIKNPSLQKDVRPVLHKRFHMLEWFQMHGIPASALTV
ncbi:hypothetical protein NC652_036903 [Populus alba x Populus x berolinensis]|nr:hypothetical protein NC652_036903 [Populus alba x Populus x berolinensis]